jgi:iron complex outermembrane receptor protein
MKGFFLFCCFFVLGLSAFSQEQPLYHRVRDQYSSDLPPEFPDFTRDTFHIREVEVFAGRNLSETALRMVRADSMSLHSGLTTDLSELISRNTPVFIRSYGKGSQATAHFRGTSASHAGILWNGMPLNSPMRGYSDLSQLPLFFVDNLWVLHGGSSLTVAPGALGGDLPGESAGLE